MKRFEIIYSTATEHRAIFTIDADFEQDAMDAFFYEVQSEDDTAEVICVTTGEDHV